MPAKKKGYKKTKAGVELDADVLDPKNHSVRITMMIEGDLLLKLRKSAKAKGLAYQTYLKLILRDHFSSKPSLEDRITALEKLVRTK